PALSWWMMKISSWSTDWVPQYWSTRAQPFTGEDFLTRISHNEADAPSAALQMRMRLMVQIPHHLWGRLLDLKVNEGQYVLRVRTASGIEGMISTSEAPF